MSRPCRPARAPRTLVMRPAPAPHCTAHPWARSELRPQPCSGCCPRGPDLVALTSISNRSTRSVSNSCRRNASRKPTARHSPALRSTATIGLRRSRNRSRNTPGRLKSTPVCRSPRPAHRVSPNVSPTRAPSPNGPSSSRSTILQRVRVTRFCLKCTSRARSHCA